MFCDNSPKKPQADPPPVALLHGASHNASANTLRPPPRIPYASHSPICPSAHCDSLGTGQLSLSRFIPQDTLTYTATMIQQTVFLSCSILWPCYLPRFSAVCECYRLGHVLSLEFPFLFIKPVNSSSSALSLLLGPTLSF